MAFSVAVCGGFAEGGPPLDPVSTSGSSAMKESCLDELIRDSLSRPVISIRRVFSFLFFFTAVRTVKRMMLHVGPHVGGECEMWKRSAKSNG